MESTHFRLKKVGVIMIGVSNLARSVTFYRDTLGLPLQHQFGGFAFFDADGVTLTLSEPVGHALGGKPGAIQIVFSVEDVRAAHAALTARGVTFIREPFLATGTMWSANFTDPDGQQLALFGPERKA